MKNCHECQAEVSDMAASCPRCGVPYNFKSSGPYRSTKSRSTAVVLALLLGGIGAHKFYLNRPIWGVIYVLFLWTYIPAILLLRR